MKITIELTNAQILGIKKYLCNVSPEITPKIKNEDIKREAKSLLLDGLYAGAIGDEIVKAENNESI